MQISDEKVKRIKEDILALLFNSSPNALFTSFIARDTARDEEFIKKLMEQLYSKSLVAKVNKNPRGKEYSRRIRWRLTEKAYQAYKELGGKRL